MGAFAGGYNANSNFIVLAEFFVDIKMVIRVAIGLTILVISVCFNNPPNVPDKDIFNYKCIL